MKNKTHPFAQMLQRELVERTKRNPAYSLRAFAKALDMNHAHLSLVLRGERPVTQKLITRAATLLGMNVSTVSRVLNNKVADSNQNSWVPVNTDEFESISEWYHDAILELVRLSDFQSDYAWIAREIGITPIQAKDAVERLLRLGFLERLPDGSLNPHSPDTTTNVDTLTTSTALRRLQMSLLEKSKAALENHPRDVRDHTSLVVSISKRDFNKAKKMITEFRQKLMHSLQNSASDFDEVYQLTVSFFPLTSGKREVQKKRKSKPKNAETNAKETEI